MTTEIDAWIELNQAGRLLDRERLEKLPVPEIASSNLSDHLRDALTATVANRSAGSEHRSVVADRAAKSLSALLDVVLEEACGLRDGWRKGSAVGAADAETLLDGTAFKPRRVLVESGENVLVVFAAAVERVGLHKGRRVVSQVVEYLRRRRVPLGLVTNGREWRLVFADVDNLAWVEWAADRWLEGDTLTHTFGLLRRVLSRGSLARSGGVGGERGTSKLLTAIRLTRGGQARLSKELGERVRASVELLLRARRPVLDPTWDDAAGKSVYNAACHFVMRLVVVLFAEARELLPVDNPIYHLTYGLRGLLEALERAGAERRRMRTSAWPRLLALFRLLHQGSLHPQLVVTTYGGELFKAGNAKGDAIQCALALLEATADPPDDETIYRMIVLLTRTTERVRDGNETRIVAAPVDFTELTSEYIGILYEGLLDYELHRAGDDPVVFLALGDQPALPLDRLEAMNDKQLAGLVEKAKAKGPSATDEGDGDADDESDVGDETANEPDDDVTGETPSNEETQEDDLTDVVWKRALDWARRAALAGKLVRPSRGKKGAEDPAWQAVLDRAARQLIADVKLPHELFLVRWGGTRKGAGTFYTRPQLTLPTVRRTLEPLLVSADGRSCAPEALLSLKVCDPAMGSGSFLVAALRVLTDAAVRALHEHGRIVHSGSGSLVHIECALIPEADRDQPDDRVEAIVRRAVVEHCLYGVDLDPLAVELARVSLWVETLDRRLPFTFLDHKLRCGDALVGTWLDRFRDYPLLAWWRASPDEKWRGVTHEGDTWAKALKDKRVSIVEEQRKILDKELRLAFTGITDKELTDAIVRVRDLYRALHEVPATQPDMRAEIWRAKVIPDPALARVREAMDTWCALWFWPLDRLDDAPRPMDLAAPSQAARKVVAELAVRRRFFHWELEFPDVFTEVGAGFDAIVANPPWEVRKPSSMEFFSDRNPLYRALGRQEALVWQREEFKRDADFERAWLDHVGTFKDAGNFVRCAGEPFGDGEDARGVPAATLAPRKAAETKRLHRDWAAERGQRQGLSDREHPFLHQGSADLNSYKLFVEQGHALLRRGGQLGLITPSGLYTDKGSSDLRSLLLTRCRWRWLYGFENRNKIFDIYYRFKFAVVIAEKGSPTTTFRAAFMRHDLEDWADARDTLEYPAERIETFSPKSLSVLEIRSQRDLDVLTKLYSKSVLLGDEGADGWGIRYATEFHMTNDSQLFIGREIAKEAGYKPDQYGRWIAGEGDVLLPLYEGRMIGQFDFSKKGWVSGKGRTSVWRDIPWEMKVIEPQFVMRQSDAWGADAKARRGPKIAYMRIGSATNSRTVISTYLRDTPAGDSIFFFVPTVDPAEVSMSVVGIFGSYVYDFVVRSRIGGLNLSEFLMVETPLIPRVRFPRQLVDITLRLAGAGPWFAPEWLELGTRDRKCALGGATEHERLRLRSILDATLAAFYGLSRDDFRWILRDCDWQTEAIGEQAWPDGRAVDRKGFWRVDKDQEPEIRHTVLSLVAFDALLDRIAANGGDRDKGLAAFLALNDGEGWMLPETLRLADHDLGHDERAKVVQPVASRLGPRFLDWQLKQSAEESWAECERHARVILGDAEFDQRFGNGTSTGAAHMKETTVTTVTQPESTRSGAVQPGLFDPGPTTPTTPTFSTAPAEALPMRISNIRLLNFRNWSDEHWEKGIELAPITLVLGRNSAGKTSILQPLRMLKQTIEETDAGTELLLDGTASDGVDLGAYTDTVHDHDENHELGVGFDLAGEGIKVDVRFQQVSERPVIASLEYRLHEEWVTVTRVTNAWKLDSPRFKLADWDGKLEVNEPRRSYCPNRATYFSEQALSDLGPTLGSKLRRAMVAVKGAFERFYYLGPTRVRPRRVVTWSQQEPTKLGSAGSETIQALIGSETGRNRGILRQATSQWLQRLDLADAIEITRVGRTLYYQIDVIRGDNRSNIVDVGFGVSQVLPVIVLLHFVPEGSVILCEDPEAHLHPMAQAVLADMFVEVARERKLQVLLETHSEHLFRRLQYLMAEGKVKSDDCALYYVDREQPSARIARLTTNEFGQVANWPKYFFGDAMGETERQVRKIIERKRGAVEEKGRG